MVKFTPVSYNEGDFRAFKYVGSSDVCEGEICSVCSIDLNTFYCKGHSGTLQIVGTNVAVATVIAYTQTNNKYFPVFREDPDIESISATISTNDFVIGYFGREWQVYYDACVPGACASWEFGHLVAIGSTGKFAIRDARQATDYIIARCIGTQNGWVRMERL